jgi:hypothetical protein
MARAESQQNEPDTPNSDSKVIVLNPACSSTMAERIPLAQRMFSSLQDKTIFLVDIGWGGPKAGYEVLEIMQEWFARNIPSVKTILVRKKGSFSVDDPELWERIKAEGDACIIGISC